MKLLYTLRKNICVLFILAGLTSSAQISVDSTFSPTNLVQTLIGAGVTVSNISYTGDTTHASGLFTDPVVSFGIADGILLTTGMVENAVGPNDTPNAQFDGFLPGDSLLQLYTTDTTGDACILEFDFTSVSDSVEFNYVFGSEEYNEWVGLGFNDVFGFFISGPGIVGIQNIAVLPGTTTPVSIANINNGVAPVDSPSTGPCMNCQYYVDNLTGTSLQYDGYTTVLTARAGVIPCETYHIKLAIADVLDRNWDSGVLLEGHSFKSSGVFQVAYNGGDAPGTLNLCPGTCATLTAPYMYNYNWNTGDTTQTIVACTAGVYYVSTTNGACTATSSSVNVVPVSGPPAVTISNAFHVLSSSITDPGYSYQWYLGAIPFPGATSSTLTLSVSGCYYVAVTDSNGCQSLSDTICDTNVGVDELNAGNFSIQPNPSPGIFTIEVPAKISSGEILITDVSGKLVLSESWTTNTSSKRVNASELAKGIYFLQLKTEKSVSSRRLVIE